jgi:general secretion pathway protein C
MARARKNRNKAKPPATKAADVAEAIIAQALVHPDLGPQRLALLLKSEGLDVSKDSIYKALRRRGLQTRELRIRFASQPDALKAGAPAAAIAAPPAPSELPLPPAPAPEQSPVAAALLAEAPESVPADFLLPDERHPDADSGAAPAHPRTPYVYGSDNTANGKIRWAFRIANLLLAGLAVLFAVHIGTTLQDALRPPSTPADVPAPAQASSEPPPAADVLPKAPLQAYHVIVERNLFGTARTPTPDETQEAAELAKIKLVGSELGLKLIGTTVAADRRLNQAVIESARQRSQEIYRERERAGGVLIKRILRNNVIIATERGEQRLTVDYENVKAPSPSPAPAAPTSARPGAAHGTRMAAMDEPPAVESPEIHFSMPRDSLSKSLANPAALLSEMGVASGKDQPPGDGLRLGLVNPRNPLARLGLRTGDVIREFDGESVSGPADAESLLKTLSEGGDFNVLVERRGRPLRLNLSIE